MTARDPRDDRLRRWAERLIDVIGRAVPASRRSDWHREWEAEIAHALRRSGDRPRTRGRLARRIALAIPDAVLVRLYDTGRRPERAHTTTRQGAAPMLEGLLREFRITSRSLARQPGFTAVAVLTIGLGIGAATTIFSLVDGILLEPLPYPEPDRLVAVWPERWYSGALFDVLEEESDSYAALAAWAPRSFTETDDRGARQLWGVRTTGDFLRVLRATPDEGRVFGSADDAPAAEGGLVLSHEFWESRFGGDPSALGRRLRIANGEIGDRTVPIVGVMPPGFEFQPGNFTGDREPADFAITVPFDRDAPRYRSSEFKVVGRLADGVTSEQAVEELRTLTAAWRERYGLPDSFGEDVSVVSLKRFMTGSLRSSVFLLFGAVGVILLIATVNVANLLLARALSRRKEVAVRVALGATGSRVVRQLLSESTLLGALGSVVGILVAIAGVAGVRALLPPGTPRIESVGVDASVIGFAVLVALVAGWLVGFLPAIRASRADVRSALGGDSRGSTSGRRSRGLRTGLLVTEIGLAVVLLSSTGLLLKSFRHLSQVDPGFRAEGLSKLYVRPGSGRVGNAEAFEQYFRVVDERLEALPGVVGAALVSQAPITGDGGVVGYSPADRPPAEGEESPRVRWRQVSPDYFAVAGIPILDGRGLSESDRIGSEPVAVLSRQAADELFPGEEAVGRRVVSGFESDEPVTIVGVVGDVRLLGPAEASLAMMYRPYAQTVAVMERFGFGGSDVVLRTGAGAGNLAARTRATLREADPLVLATGLETISSAMADTLAERRTTLILLSLFAVGALLLGAIGIYGVTGYLVRERRREMGVRMAVGASAGRVVREVLGAVLRVATVGAVLGVLASLLLAGVLRHFVVDVAATDPEAIGLAVVVALVVALVAGFGPARAAGRADPLDVLAGGR